MGYHPGGHKESDSTEATWQHAHTRHVDPSQQSLFRLAWGPGTLKRFVDRIYGVRELG